jgi:O-antigen ligase
MRWLVLAFTALLAIALGGIAALFGGLIALILFVPILAIGLVVLDYRAGVIVLTLMLPFSASPLLPGLKGLNSFNYIVAATVLVFLVHRVFGKKAIALPPKLFAWCYLLPMFVAVVIGLGHLAEGRQYVVLAEAVAQFEPVNYVKQRLMGPLFFVAYAILLANAVRDSSRPERFLILLSAAAVVPALVILGAVVILGGDLSVLQSHRDFLSRFGLHANEFGMLLAIASGPLVYLAGAAKGGAKLTAGVALALVLAGLMLTFSRGAYVAFFVVLMIYLYELRRFRMIAASVIVGAAIMFAGPAAFRERITTGANSATLESAESGNLNDPLTAGRIGIYYMLVPEVARSPLWGRGAGATSWSDAVRSGRYNAGHPHNMYLEILLDVGALGFVALMYLYFRYYNAMRSLARSDELSPVLRAYFAGTAAAFVGMLTMDFSNGHWLPHPEQSYLWFALGMLFAYWPVVDRSRQVDKPGPRGALSRRMGPRPTRSLVAWVPGRFR